MLTTGLHRGVPDAVYHQRRKGVVSKSALDVFARSPAHYLAWLTEPDEDTPALAFGRAFHCAVLEPERFAREYAAQPDFGDLRTKAARAERAEWVEAHPGVRAISADDAERIAGMTAAIMRHPVASRLLVGAEREVALSWEDNLSGLRCKSRTDAWRPDLATILDLKSTEDASPAEFARSVDKYRYDVQDALYRMGMRAAAGIDVAHFVLCAVEKQKPHDTVCYQLDEAAIVAGGNTARVEMMRFAECVRTDKWPGYSDRLETLSLPRWSQRASAT